ncbi:MAG: ABC transporter permease [Acidobacteriota bacterium]|nr:MAG: ABC transporter permease [Acidobacteriota bacterium]
MTLLNDMRYGFRMLVKRPGLSAIAIIALALGIGLTTTMFGIVYGAVIRGMPFEESENLIALFRNRPSQDVRFMAVSIHDFGDWREQQTSFEDIAGYYSETVNVAGTEGKPIRYLGAYVNAHLFDILRVQPLLGRNFRPEEDHPSTPPVIILSYRAWQDRYQGDPNVIGRSIRANSEMTTIVGVMPEKFGFPQQMDAWLPLRIDPLEFVRGGGPALEGTQFLAIGRLRDGVSLDAAQTEMSGIAGRLAAEYPETNEGVGVSAVRFIDTIIGPEGTSMMYTMLGAVFGVLLIACANVANLLLARTVLRTKEVAIRTALGSSSFRTVSQLLSETLVLALVGAALGLGLAKIGVDWFNASLSAQELPFWLVATLDPPVVAFVLGLALLSTVLAGTVPAYRASRTDISEILGDESRGSSSLRLGRVSKSLVVAEIAVSCGLLVAAGLMIKTVVQVSQFDYGFNTDNVFTSRIGLFEADYPDRDAQWQFYEELLRNLEDKPGVRTVTLSSDLPARGGMMLPLSMEGVAYSTEKDHPLARRIVIAPGYFDVIDAKPLEGRAFTRGDTKDTQPVAIVNERFVELNLSDEEPLGRRIKLGDDDEPWRTIVGVVPDLHLGGAIGQFDPRHEGVYIPLSQNVINFMSLVMRTEEAPMTFTSMVQDEINAIDTTLPIYWVRSLNDQYALDTWFYRTFGTLFMAFGVAALVLATIGLYGVMSFAASNRTREIGVRMALGAGAQNVMMLILKLGATQIAIGLALGLALALVLSRALGAMLFNVDPWDPMIFVSVVLTLATAGLVASLIPARRATRIDPVDALSYE